MEIEIVVFSLHKSSGISPNLYFYFASNYTRDSFIDKIVLCWKDLNEFVSR